MRHLQDWEPLTRKGRRRNKGTTERAQSLEAQPSVDNNNNSTTSLQSQQPPQQLLPAKRDGDNKENNSNSAGSGSTDDNPQSKKPKNDATLQSSNNNNDDNNNKPSFSNDDERNDDDMDCDDDTAKSTAATNDNNIDGSNNNTTDENQSSNLDSNVSNGDVGLSNNDGSNTSRSIISSIVDEIKDRVVDTSAEGGDSEESARNDLGEEDINFGDGGNDDAAAAMLNEIEPPSSSIGGDDNYDMDYLSDSDQYISIEESRYRTSIVLPTNSQIGFEIALAAVAAEPDSDTDEEEEDDNEGESSVDVEQRDDTDTQGRGNDAGSVSQSLLDMPLGCTACPRGAGTMSQSLDMSLTRHQCSSVRCAACPQAATALETTAVTNASAEASAASESTQSLPGKVDCDICQDISYKLEECSSDDCNKQVCEDHLCSTCTLCGDCCDCQEEESALSSTASASSEVEADENDSSGESEEEEVEDHVQTMLEMYPNVLRAQNITKPQIAGNKCLFRRSINRNKITFGSSGTYGTGIGPCLVFCAMIYALDLLNDGGGGGRGGTVNCIFSSSQIKELYDDDVSTLRRVLESDPNNVEVRSLAGRDDVDLDNVSIGVRAMLTKVIDNLTSERSHSTRGRHYKRTLINNAINNLIAIRDAIEAGVEPPSFLWENQDEPRLDSSELLAYEIDPKKMNSHMEMFALYHFYNVNKKLAAWLNPRGRLSIDENLERIKNRAVHGARSIFELFFRDSHYAAQFKLYLTEDEQNNPNDIPIERKKELCLTFLHEEGYVAKYFTPITLVPSESLNSLNASEEEKKAFWEKAIPELFKNKERVIAELEERKGKLAKLPQRQERTRSIVQQHRGVFSFIESMQHTRPLQEDETLESFSDGLMPLVNAISGLESLTFGKLTDITEAEFANVADNHHRTDKLGELARTLFGYIDGGVEGKCALCDNKLSEHSTRSSMAFHGEHPNDKTADPNRLAVKANNKFVPEILDPEKGLIHTCSKCNDKGTRRKEPLKIFKFVRLILGEEGGRDDHKTVLELCRDPTMKLKYQIWEIEKACRGMTSTSFDTRCGFTTARVAFNAIYSSEGDCHLLDDLTRMSAERYMSDDITSFRFFEFAQISTNLITSHSQSCMGANQLVSPEAEQRRDRGETLTEKDYVCNKKTVPLTNKAPYEYYSISGDHEDDSDKKFNPAQARGKNVFERIDELCKVAMTCDFCHSIRTWHQRRATRKKLKIQRCFYTIGSQIFKAIGRR